MESLKPDTCYHIYNHANGFENVFNERENYSYFLEKYQEYIGPVAETYSYCTTFPKLKETLEKLNINVKFQSQWNS